MRSLIIIPSYNERENIEKLINQIFTVSPDFDILVVDDNSPDGTGQLLDEIALRLRQEMSDLQRETEPRQKRGEEGRTSQDKTDVTTQLEPRLQVIHRSGKLGLGTAYIAGFQYALEHNYDYIFEMDADLSHEPKYLLNFLEKIKDGFDLVIGSRYLEGISVVHWDLKRLLLSLWASFYARTITGLALTDPMSGFKCYRKKVLESIPLDKVKSNGYSFQMEMHYRVAKAGFKLAEVPIVFVDRFNGKSKMGWKIILEAALMAPRLRLGLV